jgi:hypothetical protein
MGATIPGYSEAVLCSAGANYARAILRTAAALLGCTTVSGSHNATGRFNPVFTSAAAILGVAATGHGDSATISDNTSYTKRWDAIQLA